MSDMAADKYHISIRILHWSMAIIILGMIGVGWYMEGLPRENLLKGQLVALHKSFGIVALVLLFLRVVFRVLTKIPALPETIPAIERVLANLGHKLLYVLMFIVPLSGYAMSNLYGYGVKMFGIDMPRLFPEDKALGAIAREAHEILPYVFLGLILLHFGAAIQHRFFDKKENDVLDSVVTRFVPREQYI